MSSQQQEQLAALDAALALAEWDGRTTDNAIMIDWYGRLDPFLKQWKSKDSPELLRNRDIYLLHEISRDLERLTNNALIAEHLVITIGHMNTKEGELALCKLILDVHKDGPIAKRITPLTERRDKEVLPTVLAGKFNPISSAEYKGPLAPAVMQSGASEPAPAPRT